MLNVLPLVVTTNTASLHYAADTQLANSIADKWGFPITREEHKPTEGFYLLVSDNVLGLADASEKKVLPIVVDFASPASLYRKQHGGGHKEPIVKAIGTSAALGIPISISASIGFMVNSESLEMPYTIGFVYWPAVIMMSAASALTTRIGTHLAHKLSAVVMKRVFAALISVLVLNMARTLWL